MSHARLLVALSAVIAAAPAVAEPPTSPPLDASAADAGAAAVAPPSPAVLEREAAARRKARMRCGCASPRMLRRGSEVTLGDGRALTVWLRDDGEATLRTFTQPDRSGPSTSVSAPVAEQPFVVEAPGMVATPSRLLRVYASGPSEPFYLGVEIPPRTVPGDVVSVTVDGSAGAPEPGPPPALEELWLGPFVDRVTPTCGRVASRRLRTEAKDGDEPIAAFLVEYTPAGGEPRAALVDERHARIFGLGRVDPCEHGVPLDEGPGEITVRPVGERFGIGPAWTFTLPADASAMPTHVTVPSGKTLKASKNPFLIEPRDPLDDLYDSDIDRAAIGLMAFVIVGAGMLAQLTYRARKKRKPFLVETACPACEAALTLDLHAPETDGMFCPKCGRSSVFVAFGADGAPKAKVISLAEDGRAGPS